MSLSLSRRLTTPLIAAAAATGLVLGVSSGVAAADPPQSSNTQRTLQLAIKKEVVGSNAVYPGASVSYRITVSYDSSGGEAPLNQLSIPWVRDVPPAGFVRTAAVLTYANSTAHATYNSNADGGVTATCSSGCTFLVGGYVIKAGQPAVLDTTYTVPANYAPGVYDSGALVAKPNAWSGSDYGANPFNVNVQVLDPTVTTTTTLNVPAGAKVGQPTALTANVGPSTAVGTVQFKDGGVNIGAPVTVSGGAATLNHTFTTVGNHVISAAYTAGPGFYSSTSTALNVAVSLTDTTTTIDVPATALTTEAVNLTANVAPVGATGTVQFKDGAVNIGAPVVLNAGSATLSQTFATPGNHAITAVYSGDANYRTSTSAIATVNTTLPAVDSTTTLTAPATAVAGTAVNLAATVSPAGATGTVEFRDSATVLGSAPVNGGVATLSHTFTTDGTHSITAAYSGDATNNPSTSPAATVEVTTAPLIVDTTTTLNVPATAKTGTAVDLTANVSPADATGTVEFKDGATTLGSALVNGGVATLSHTFTTDGMHSITAVYSGDSANHPSTSAAGTVEVSTEVVAGESVTTLTIPATAQNGILVDLVAHVAPAGATGTVEFKDGNDVLGSAPIVNGTATLSHAFTTDGTHSITAVYSGDATNNGSTSVAHGVVVSPEPTDPGGNGSSGSLGSIFGS